MFFIMERYFSSFSYFITFRVISLAIVAGAAIIPLALSFNAKKKSLDGEAKSWKLVFLWQSVTLLGLLAYLVYIKVLGDHVYPEDFKGKVLLAVWVSLVLIGFFMGVGIELSHYSGGQGIYAEPRRLLYSGQSWTLIGMFLGSLICLNYAATERDKIFDWSYFKTTKPSDASMKMVGSLDKDLEIALFFPATNEIKPYVSEYFTFLSKGGNKIKLSFFDKELNPVEAEKFKVSSNGMVVLSYDNNKKYLRIGDELKQARDTLKKLDGTFQKEFLSLTSKRKVAYFTRGHEEMKWTSGEDMMRSIRGVEMILSSQNITLKTFAGPEGALVKVPGDANMVVIAGPLKPFLKEEVAVLKDYLELGGNILICFSNEFNESGEAIKVTGPGEEDPLMGFVKEYGLIFKKTLLANDQSYVVATRTNVDKLFLYTNIFGSHESVSGMSKYDDKIQIFTYQGSYFERDETKNRADIRIYETIKSLSSTFNDVNKNYTFDGGPEARKSHTLAAAVEVTGKEKDKKGKLLVMANAAAISDFLLRNVGNQLLVLDSIRWFTGSNEVKGLQTTEEDVKIQHTRAKDIYVFYGTIFAVPFLVLLTGFLYIRRNRLKRVGGDA
ncbi:MAG: Gldg family protein [Oligoflexales bacterium]|nr:Gldg family protein [Oligoflexales bacterium]